MERKEGREGKGKEGNFRLASARAFYATFTLDMGCDMLINAWASCCLTLTLSVSLSVCLSVFRWGGTVCCVLVREVICAPYWFGRAYL